jgi:hypothetical protein
MCMRPCVRAQAGSSGWCPTSWSRRSRAGFIRGRLGRLRRASLPPARCSFFFAARRFAAGEVLFFFCGAQVCRRRGARSTRPQNPISAYMSPYILLLSLTCMQVCGSCSAPEPSPTTLPYPCKFAARAVPPNPTLPPYPTRASLPLVRRRSFVARLLYPSLRAVALSMPVCPRPRVCRVTGAHLPL